MKPCKYANGVEGEWECTCYNKVDCPYQDVDYNYFDFATGHKEINVVSCTKAERNGEMTNQEKFIQIFGIDAWEQMVAFSGLAEQFKEYWTSPYNESEDLNADS